MKLIYTGDFERLKEFGFIINYYGDGTVCSYTKQINWNEEYIYQYYICTDERWSEYRELMIETNTQFCGSLDETIYDLIQAGLVKKEEE